MSPESFTQLSAEEMHENAKSQSSIDIRHFGSLDAALEAMREHIHAQV
jgi:nucleoid DNA-binding protein